MPRTPAQPARRDAAEPASTAGMTLHRLRFGYRPGQAVLDAVTAKLVPGRVTCLIGPNASGKSTLVKLMLGQLDPWAGEVRLAGRRVGELRPRERARWVSYVPQRGGVQFAFTVREVVAMGRFAARGEDHGLAIDAALAACDLADVADRVFAELSGGQQQRVLIARAFAQSHEAGRAMLLDEPGSHLDLRHVHAMMGMLREQASRGLAVLVVLHDLNLAARYADDVWLMHEGRLAAAGRWDAVLRAPVLEPAYGVALEALGGEADGRPVFRVAGLR